MPVLYRVVLRNTRCLMQRADETIWNEQVLYCGFDADEARRVLRDSQRFDEFHQFGGVCRETITAPVYDHVHEEWGFPYKCRGCLPTCPLALPLASPLPALARRKRKRKSRK